MIKAIIFDCFGVLTVDSWYAFIDSLPSDILDEARAVTHAYDSGVITKPDLVSKISELTGAGTNEVAEASSPKLAKNQEVFEYIAELKKLGYKTAILSNVSDDWITRVLLSDAEKLLFDEFVFSFQVGTAKPDPLMYDTVCQKLGVKTPECVFIDDQERYCTVAQDLGMKAIHYKNFADFKDKLDQIIRQS